MAASTTTRIWRESRIVDAACVRRWLEVAAARIESERHYLTQLDAAIGGAAVEGDKTMVDALAPGLAAFEAGLRHGTLEGAVRGARVAAMDGARATVPLQARKGRASYLGPRSVGHQDPGATSTALVLAALERTARAGD